MRVMVMFDLPTLTSSDKKEYRKFRKYLIKNGFIMMQESIYTKLALNQAASEAIVNVVKNHKPKSGIVQIAKMTEKQFNAIEYIVGKKQTNVVDSDKRVVFV